MKDRIMLWIAYRLPRRFMMWCYIVIMAEAMDKIDNRGSIDDLSYTDVWNALFKEEE